MKKWILLFCTILWAATAIAQEDIRLNQVGFYPDGEKVAIILSDQAVSFAVIEDESGVVVFEGESSSPDTWSYSEETVVVADFSSLASPGTYRVSVEGLDDSWPFQVSDNVHLPVAAAAVKYYYFNRASTALEEEFAGPWARPMGHPDEEIIVHSSAATDERPEGYTFSSPKGWYDAGDFNKYIVNSGISTYTMMAAYEHFPEYYDLLTLNIPESGSGQPDLLDEIRWNLDWMITMQDPNDGGVYHKLTTKNFSGQVMPHQASANRYVVMKSTAATLNFAAVMAVASRVYQPYDPEFSAEALEAAEYAWQWANENPNVIYQQPNDIYTGEYGDNNLGDEFDWAAAELYITTGDDAYWDAFDESQTYVGFPSWQYVRPLAWISLAHHLEDLTNAANPEIITGRITHQAGQLRSEYESSAYRISMGQESWHFLWGSNAMALNHSVLLIQAYRLTMDESYLDAAQSNLDYILGRNATGYSFVTGYGSRTPMDPHHRQSSADNNTDPVPGMVVGGPHDGQQDNCSYPSNLPAKSYLDSWCSYSTNEVAINWNAALTYVSGGVDYYRSGAVETSNEEKPISERPVSVELSQNFPNPFNPTTIINYQLPQSSQVRLEVFDITGRQVAILVDGTQSAGTHSAEFDASNLASGVYLYRITVNQQVQVRMMTLVK
ncbi:T9SS C-terminal target domain-containing protein [Rhodohalobacter sp. SW132]|uniref:glycoside hydrolase family 9 protein n=1 Tax=Rhodohalobacter sp. SW132 TaxID=2293433 RepID=UPI000E273F0E|nr:glycoside hydrolase family 9 protein [Rhodohalobacter sp. SW132]REL24952.1 T9SS C-terminal target domain-containing protein [Rhodohalobacter sp. SW132]